MWRKIFLATVFLGSSFHVQVQARPKTARLAPLTVSVFNDAAVAPSVLAKARERAEAVFADAGIELIWLDCGTPDHWVTDLGCRDLGFPDHLSIRLANNGTHLSGDTFGESFLNEQGEGNYASVYVLPLRSSAVCRTVNEGDLMGYVAAHEIGHLLLGKNSHAPNGLMRAQWEHQELQEAARGTLTFLTGECERMRNRLLSSTARRNSTTLRASAAGK